MNVFYYLFYIVILFSLIPAELSYALLDGKCTSIGFTFKSLKTTSHKPLINSDAVMYPFDCELYYISCLYLLIENLIFLSCRELLVFL